MTPFLIVQFIVLYKYAYMIYVAWKYEVYKILEF